MRYTIAVDFDGVLHAYTSPWVNHHTIPDAPVEGALEFIWTMLDKFDVAITSTRNKTWLGRWAMRRWLSREYMRLARNYSTCPKWLADEIAKTAFADPWEDEAWWCIKQRVALIQFPKHKPAALIYLDDRAVRFEGPGTFPTADLVHKLRPWNKAPAAR